MQLDDKLPYTAKNPLWLKAPLGLFMVFLVGVLIFVDNEQEVWEVRVFHKVALGAVFLFQLILVIHVFIERTIFHKDFIEHRTLFKRTMFRKYSEVRRFEFRATFLRILFSDGAKIDIYKATGDVFLISRIINAQSEQVFFKVS